MESRHAHTIGILILLVTLSSSTAPGARAQSYEFGGQEEVAPTEAIVWHNVTLIDLQGWRMSGVTIRWADNGETLLVQRSDGASKTYTPDQIRSIRDADGLNITAEVVAARELGAQPVTQTGQPDMAPGGAGEIGYVAASRTEPTTMIDLITPRLFDFAIDAGLGYATTSGGWFAGLDPGLNYHVGARIRVGRSNYFHLLHRHQDLGSQTFTYYEYDSYRSFTAEASLNEYQILFGHHGRPLRDTALRGAGYVEVGISVMDHQVRTSAYSNSASLTKVGFAVRGGLILKISERIAGDLTLTCTWKSALFTDSEAAGLLLGAHGGIILLF